MRLWLTRPMYRVAGYPGAWIAFALVAVGNVLFDAVVDGFADPWWHIAGEALLAGAVVAALFAFVSRFLDGLLGP